MDSSVKADVGERQMLGKANATGYLAYPGGPNRAERFKARAKVKKQDGYGWRQLAQRKGERKSRVREAETL